LRPESQQLKKYGRNSKAYPAVELKIGGYTDNVGDPTFNLKFLAIEQKSVGEMIKWVLPKSVWNQKDMENNFRLLQMIPKKEKLKIEELWWLPKNEVHVVPYNFGTIISNLFE
jgi:hypothetical protein